MKFALSNINHLIDPEISKNAGKGFEMDSEFHDLLAIAIQCDCHFQKLFRSPVLLLFR